MSTHLPPAHSGSALRDVGGGGGSPTHAPPCDHHVALMGYIDGAYNTVVQGDHVQQEGSGGSPPGVAGAHEHHYAHQHVRGMPAA